MTGHVDVTKAGRLILSIADEPGWTMKVDGEAADYDVYDGVFLSVPLTEGSHTIELSYRPAGLTTGLIVSLICCLCLSESELLRSVSGKNPDTRLILCYNF